MSALFAADLALVLAYLVLHLSGYETRIFSLSAERNIPTWYSSAKMLVLAQLLALFAWRVPAPAWGRLALTAPAVLFLLLSIDETASLHERIEVQTAEWASGGGPDVAAHWPHLAKLLLAAALAAAGVAFARLARPPASVLAKAAAGAGVFMVGAGALDAYPGLLGARGGHALGTAAEEGCELLGLTLLVWAALDLAAARPAPSG